MKVRISKSIERSSKLRQEALDIHGYNCQICNFDFELTYGEWGKEFAEVHHVKPLSELKGLKQETNPKTDLAVLCANCHRMVHRKNGITLTLDELRVKIIK
jgi:5-methylcytosine-specific restriction protein A